MSLDEAQLGQLLLGFSLGAITSMMIFGQFIDRYKSNRFSLLGCLTFGIAGEAPGTDFQSGGASRDRLVLNGYGTKPQGVMAATISSIDNAGINRIDGGNGIDTVMLVFTRN